MAHGFKPAVKIYPLKKAMSRSVHEGIAVFSGVEKN